MSETCSLVGREEHERDADEQESSMAGKVHMLVQSVCNTWRCQEQLRRALLLAGLAFAELCLRWIPYGQRGLATVVGLNVALWAPSTVCCR